MARYHKECDEVLERFREGLITTDEAMRELSRVERNAYERDPYAEPDGDVTYSVALAVEEIRDNEDN